MYIEALFRLKAAFCAKKHLSKSLNFHKNVPEVWESIFSKNKQCSQSAFNSTSLSHLYGEESNKLIDQREKATDQEKCTFFTHLRAFPVHSQSLTDNIFGSLKISHC